MVVLASGSSGNCTLVEGSRGRVLIDCGLSARAAAARLRQVGCEPRSIDAVVVTHEHADHVSGAPMFSRRFGAAIFTSAATAAAAGIAADEVAGLFPMEAGHPIEVGDLTVSPFSVPHDAADNVGLVVECSGTRLGYATDLGHLTALVIERLRECDFLVTEANHDARMLKDGPYPWSVKQRILSRHGHLSNEEMVALVSLVAAPRTRRIFLAHLSETNNRPDLAVAACRRGLQAAGRSGVEIEVARQREVSEVVEA
ncbi:MAG TPA: MBL fold metallo-hydrolase [Candidatus Polarisedimenticolia bacterium]